MKLFFLNGPRQGENVDLTPPGISIGREEDNDVQLLIAGVSRYHAKLTFDGTNWQIQDLGSTNGTHVNGKPVSGALPLREGDSIAIGDQRLIFGTKLKKVEPALKPITQPSPKPVPAPDAPTITSGPVPSSEKISADTLFRSKKKKEAVPGKGPEKQRKFKLLYPVLVFALAVIVLAVFVKLNMLDSKQPAETKPVREKPDFVLNYERIKVEPANIFRFSLTVENESAEFTLDDLKYGRHFQKSFKAVPARALNDLRDAVLGTEFMKLKQEPLNDLVTGKIDETRKLTIILNHNENTITVRNNFAKSSFETIERAIEKFSDDNGLSSVSMNVEEMKDYAIQTFRKAEDLFQSYQAKPENLREAIARYKLAMEYLDQFVPKPAEWELARRHLAEAEQLFEKLRKDLDFNIQQYYRLNDYARASAECQKAMDLLGPDSKAYLKIKSIKLEMDRKLRRK